MQDTKDRAVGWYRDPVRPRLHRYWNGQSWLVPEGSWTPLSGRGAARTTGDAEHLSHSGRGLDEAERDA